MQRKFISRRSFLKCAGMGAVTAAAAGLLAVAARTAPRPAPLLRLRLLSPPIPTSPTPA